MTSNFDDEINEVEDEYYGEDGEDLADFIVYSADDEDRALKKQKHQEQQEEDQDQEEEQQEEEESSEEEEEAPPGVQEILSLREQLKEKIRRKNAALAGTSYVMQTTTPAKDKFGSFFGKSRLALAPRVIQDGCSSMMKELQDAPFRKNVSSVSEAQPRPSRSLQKPKIVSQEKRRADALRENRNYSSVFSDDAESPPSSTKENPGNGPVLVPKSGVQARGPVNSAGKKNRAPNGHGLKGAAPSGQARVQGKAGSQEKGHLADRKRTVATARNGSTPAAMKKPAGLSNGQKLQPALKSKRLLPAGQRQQKLPQASQSQRLQSNGHQQIRKHAQGQASSKFKASRPMEKRAVKRKADEIDDYESISKQIRALSGYDPSKYAGRDEDDSDMEVDYATIQKEERRSAKLARQEDQEQLRLIEEEERRERAKKKKKPALPQE